MKKNYHIVVSDIDWDTDGESVNLPNEVVISNPTPDMLADVKEDGYGDSIADYLSDNYGFCVNNFSTELEAVKAVTKPPAAKLKSAKTR